MIDYLNPFILEMLNELGSVLQSHGTDFYLVGAVARDVRLSVSENFKASRRTNDVDIAIMLADEAQFYVIKDALLATGHFVAHDTESIKLFYKDTVELDLLPFGEIENEARETRLQKPRLFVLDMPGFQEVFPDAEVIRVGEHIDLKVSSLEGLVLLKLLANDSNPGRTKDLTDIEHIISVYFDLNDLEIYSDHLDVMDLYDVEDRDYLKLISCRVIGRHIGNLLRESHQLRTTVREILRKRRSLFWTAITDGISDTQ